jgi:acetyltransferase-like isoleucine patch superfamily enzyme
MRSLDNFRRIRKLLVSVKRGYLRHVWGMDIHPTVEMSLSAQFDKTYPQGIHIEAFTYIAFDARILTHDMTRNVSFDTQIGKNCFIGGRVLILPGVTIGNSCIVGAGSVVTRSVPSHCIVAGNPAKIVREGISLLTYGRIPQKNSETRF